jgi:2-succinyl-5-enolpyruvyl-6-hydroxy-3-cyclohexene-1-carboxylate synthase
VAKDRFERLWGTPHGMDLASVARAYGLPVTAVARPCDLPPALAAASEGGGVRVIHVRTDREANVAVHREIEEAVRQAVVSL